MPNFTVPVQGLHCDGCVTTVSNAVGALDGVHSVSVDLDTKGTSTVHVDADTEIPDETIAGALTAEGNFQVVRAG